MALHKNLTGTDLHEPKGVAAVTEAGKVYASDGTGSGAWTSDITPATLALTTKVYRSITVTYNGVSSKTHSTLPLAGVEKWNDDGAGSGGVWSLAFDPDAATAADNENAFLDIGIPSDYDPGTDITLVLAMSTPDANVGDIVWGFEYSTLKADTLSSNTSIIYETTASPEAAKTPKRVTFSTIISGTNILPNMCISGRLFRDANDAADTYASDAYIHSIRFMYESKNLGTAGMFA